MTFPELQLWCAYREKYGPINPVRMYDTGAAIVASQVTNMMGGNKTTAKDFMPYIKGVEESSIDDDEGMLAALMASGRAKIGR